MHSFGHRSLGIKCGYSQSLVLTFHREILETYDLFTVIHNRS